MKKSIVPAIIIAILVISGCIIGRVNLAPVGDPKGCIQPGPCVYLPEIMIVQDAGPDADYYPENF